MSGGVIPHTAQAASPFWQHLLHPLSPSQPVTVSSPAGGPPVRHATTSQDSTGHPTASPATSPGRTERGKDTLHSTITGNRTTPPAAHGIATAPSASGNTDTAPARPLLPPAPLSLTNEDRQAQLTLFTALNFMLPRLLSVQSPQQLCLWGMATLLGDQPVLHEGHTHPQPGSATARHTGMATAAPFHLALAFQPEHPPLPASLPSTGDSKNTPLTQLVLLEDHQPLLAESMPAVNDITGWSQLSTRFMARLHHDIPQFQTMSDEAILARFLNGMLARLDPYSRYLPPTAPPSPSDQLDEHEPPAPPPAGIGLSLYQAHSRFPMVGAINLASPLWDAGIIPGDSLISLNSHSTRNTPLSQLAKQLTGPAGSTIRLGFRMQDGHYLTQDFTRGPMAEESVFPEHAGPHLILRITHFSSHTAEEISQYLSTLLPSPSGTDAFPPTSSPAPTPSLHSQPGLVLDLRGNRGGMLQQAIMTAALFLDHGVIATTEGRASEANHVWSIQGGDLTANAPLALLVDKDTGSAAEVLAAALADQQRAVVTGSSSFGKGMVQVSAIMPNGGRLTLTWAHITTPQGWALQGLGVIPQLCTASHGQFSLQSQLAALREGHSLMAPTLQQAHLVHEDTPQSTRLALRAVCPPSPANPVDLSAAFALFTTPQAYQTALLSQPDYPAAPPSQTLSSTRKQTSETQRISPSASTATGSRAQNNHSFPLSPPPP